MKVHSEIVAPLVLITLVGLALWLGPSPSEFLAFLNPLVERHGLWVVALASFIEATPPFGYYFPGSTVILVGVSLSHANALFFISMVGAITLGFVASYSLSYWIGSRGTGWVMSHPLVRKARASTEKTSRASGSWGRRLMYIHPSLAGITSLVSGACGVSWSTFIREMLPLTIAWNCAWGVITYFGATAILAALGSPYGLLGLTVALGIAWIISRFLGTLSQSRS